MLNLLHLPDRLFQEQVIVVSITHPNHLTQTFHRNKVMVKCTSTIFKTEYFSLHKIERMSSFDKKIQKTGKAIVLKDSTNMSE